MSQQMLLAQSFDIQVNILKLFHHQNIYGYLNDIYQVFILVYILTLQKLISLQAYKQSRTRVTENKSGKTFKKNTRKQSETKPLH